MLLKFDENDLLERKLFLIDILSYNLKIDLKIELFDFQIFLLIEKMHGRFDNDMMIEDYLYGILSKERILWDFIILILLIDINEI